MVADWWVYRGSGAPHDGLENLPAPPPWRVFEGGPPLPPADLEPSRADVARAVTYRPDDAIVELVNAALLLRRPLLVTGAPGTGKSTLAWAVAHELRMGQVLHWPITSRSSVRDGLYQYDPVGRLYSASRADPTGDEDLGSYIRLGPLGTALLPYARPRVLLIDEIDKSDLDLPNDLLTIFEEGEYEIPELIRAAEERVTVLDAHGTQRVPIVRGRVRCHTFPLVVMTSNEEREFPPAFLRRCILARLQEPDGAKLNTIVAAHLPDLAAASGPIVEQFLARRQEGELATDQLLNAIYLTNLTDAENRTALAARMMPHLSQRTHYDDVD